MIKAIITEYGLLWVINRSLYSAKLKMMRAIPSTEYIFERKVSIKRVDIFDIDVIKIEKFLLTLSDEKKEEIIAIADRAIEGKIRAFSSIELDYGSPINWHFNPITKVEVDKNSKWYEIQDFDPIRGDIKAVWEASRFTHFYYFARAYLITKDNKYYYAFSEQLGNWLKDNRYSYGANYKCGQEATLRMINALIVYSVFRSFGLVNGTDEENLRKLVGESYKKVLSNFFYAHKCIKNNHTLSEITGLIVGAWCSDDQRKLIKAYRLLEKEIKRQFLPDGGYIQNSVNYQRFALQLMEFNLKISNKTRFRISDESKGLIRNSILQLYQLQDVTGDVPNRGSNDGALIFPVTSSDYRDFRPVINTVVSLFENSSMYEAGVYDEEIYWFGERDLNDIPTVKIERKSMAFENSGLYSMRSHNSFLMVILQNIKTRPGQMDQLHIDLWYKGRNLLCDSGSYSYASELGKSMSLTAGHNTAKVDNKEQMKKQGPFLVYDWSSAQNVEYSDTHFKGTMTSKNGYIHTRSIKSTREGYLIEDEVVGDGEKCHINFHTPCKVRVIDNAFELISNNEVIAIITTDGKIEITNAYRSLYYLKKEEINRVTVSKTIQNKKSYLHFEIKLLDN